MVKNISEIKPGDLYVNNEGHVFRVFSYCMEPTMTMENMATGRQISGGIYSLNLKPFRPLDALDKIELLDIIENISSEMRDMLEERISLKEQIIDLKEILYTLKSESQNKE